MSQTAENQIITSEEMLRKIGLLTMSNDFLSTQVAGYRLYVETFRKKISEEIAAIEQELLKDSGFSVADAVARIKAKLG